MATATAKRKSTSDVKTIECAFCKGTGRDPYKVLSKLSNCPICNSRGTVDVEAPTVPCAFCKSTGRKRHTRLPCSACMGRGVITLAGPTIQCPQCRGSGREPEADLPCSRCKGTGLVAKKRAAGKQKKQKTKKNRSASKNSP